MKLKWDDSGHKLYETGIKQCVLYLQSNGTYPTGVAWNGVTGVTESPSGAEATPLYADDIKYLELRATEEFGATIEAYTYPDEFAECDGSASLVAGIYIGQQNRRSFGLAYKTTLGNDTELNEHGYKLHIIYGATASPSEKAYATINDSPEAITFSWEMTTTPVNVTGHRPTASIVIDSTKVNPTKLAQLEDILYGTDSANPRLPLPDEIAILMGTSASYMVTNYLTNIETTNIETTATGSYTATLTANSGYTVANVIVMMGGVDVTSTAYTSSTGVISIGSVTGPIVIYATANEN